MAQQQINYATPLRKQRLLAILASRRARRVLASLAAFAICYAGSYLGLSALGQFEPGAIGANGIKFYMWAPAGFVKDYRYRWGLFYFYLPLYAADRIYWHRNDDANTGKYPTHVPKGGAAEVYAAWKNQ